MKPDAKAVLDHVLEIGIGAGIRRHYKHRDDAPSIDEQVAMADMIQNCIMEVWSGWFSFDD
jgi:hypothetical protein